MNLFLGKMVPLTMQLLVLVSIPLLTTGSNITAPSTNATVLNIIAPSLTVEVSERQPDHITITWDVSGDDDVIDSYRIKVKGTNEAVITYEGEPYVSHDDREAMVMVHETNAVYNICLIANLIEEVSQELSTPSVMTCIEASSIKTMLASSIVALVLTILFFVLCFLIGYISWKCAIRKHESKEEYDKSDLTENGDIVPLTHIED